MDIIFRQEGQIVVDHVLQIRDVQTTGGHFGGDQHPYLAFHELAQGAATAALGLLAMDHGGLDAVEVQLFHQHITALAGTGKHQHLLPVLLADELGEQLALALLLHRIDGVADGIGGGVLLVDADDLRSVQHQVGQLLHGVGEGGGEQQVLTSLAHSLQDLLHIGTEAHVEDAIRFVQHQGLDTGEAEVAGGQVLEQPARGRHYDVRPSLEFAGLHILFATADQGQHADVQILGEVVDVARHLGGQLAGRGQDQHPGVGRLGRGRVIHQTLQYGQRKGRRLAGSGLGAGQHVAATAYGRDRLLLHRGHLLITAL